MLVGPSARPFLPVPINANADLKAIVLYLQELDKSLSTFQSAIVANTVGLIGVHGLSSTGTVAQNFVQSFNITDLTQLNWVFSSFEMDASYMVLGMQSKQSWDSFITETTRTTTDITFNFGGQVASGTLMQVVLIR